MSLEWNRITYLLRREHVCGHDDDDLEPLSPPMFDQGCQFSAECRRGHNQPLCRRVLVLSVRCLGEKTCQ